MSALMLLLIAVGILWFLWQLFVKSVLWVLEPITGCNDNPYGKWLVDNDPAMKRIDRIAERHRKGGDLKKLPDDIKAFINSSKWTYAKTMPEWPHYYIVRSADNEDMFVDLVDHIRTYGYKGRFYRKKITYFDEDEYTYWTMGEPIAETTVINRCLKENTYEKRLANGTLPEESKKSI